MKSITFDPAVYKLVPIDPCDCMKMGFAYADAAGKPFSHAGYEAVIAAVPADLPGVVAHSGEPVAEVIAGDWGGPEFQALIDWEMIPFGTVLFAHPTAQPDTAALQARIAELEAEVADTTVIVKSKINRMADCGRCVDLEAQLAASNEDRDELRFTNHVDELEREVNRLSAQADTSANDMCMLTDDFGCTVRKAQTAEVARLQAQLAVQAGQEPEIKVLRDALEKLARLGNGDYYGNSVGNDIAITALQAVPPAPANSIAIVQAALEAAQIMHDSIMGKRIAGLAFTEPRIDAIDPQTILDGMK